ncbi:flagellar motor protein MotB [Mangrovihabitans endophyticus]|uniref:Flagellar basal body stator protein MotB n=1 Tax=Mangrovihabitans endophyticus TaxID=1751298 RepID=A0A8J3FNB9_9ACTN|nr:flagellar motor protein MotB [Mangrovihabitans endophyticus]GGK82855.1 flagellar basal body stator protein MotB [Mangrovihabitans endophyticus]
MSGGGGGGRKKKGGHEEHEEHVNHERWLVSYADMLTLLFVLFVVLFSMSNVDKEKLAQLASSLSAGFGSQSAAFDGAPAILEGAGKADIVSIDPGAKVGDYDELTMSKEQREAIERAVRAEGRLKASQNAEEAAKEVANLKIIEQKISDALANAQLRDQVLFTIDERGLVVTIVTNEVVFAGDRAVLRKGGAKILDAIAPVLAKLPNDIQVDGHTNQLKVKTKYYPSGWELSAARASTVVRYLNGHGLAKNRLSAVGHSDTEPLIDPKDPRSVRMNRRVDVVVTTALTAEQAALLPSAAGKDSQPHKGQTSAEAAQEAAVQPEQTNLGTDNGQTTTHD